MARFAGNVGFGHSVEVRPGFFKDVVTEKQYFGDVTRAARQAVPSDKVNDNLEVSNSIEIVADEYASDNIFAIRYVNWGGGNWKVTDVAIQHPRLILRLGGVYNGTVPTVP